MYKAEILADSLSPERHRLTTMKTTFPRMMLAEFNTHRMFSRNSASSRAIPFKKMVKMVEENPFIPIAWQKDHKGMQGTEYLDKQYSFECEQQWLNARDNALRQADILSGYDATKQLCNRLLEPFMWHTVIVTSSDWENFFKLRCPQYEYSYDGRHYRSKKDYINNCNLIKFDVDDNLEWLKINQSQADIHIQAIAELMWDAMNESKPKELKAGEWHIPFGSDSRIRGNETIINTLDGSYDLIKIATARCARISYETLGDNPKIDYEADIRLHDMLLKSEHMSPFEHCARVMSEDEYWHHFIADPEKSGQYGWCRNFRGFIQYRHLVEQN